MALIAAGIHENAVEQYCSLIAEAFEVVVNGGIMPRADNMDIPDALKQNYIAVLNQIQSPYMKYFISMDMRPVLERIDCPVLSFNGVKDMQVDYKTNLAALRAGLSPNAYTMIEAIEGVNHLFQTCETGAVSEYADIEQTILPELLEKISGWILKQQS